MTALLEGLTRNDLTVLKQLLEDAHANMPFRGYDGMAAKLNMQARNIRAAFNVLENRKIVQRCGARRLSAILIVPVDKKLPVPERRGGRTNGSGGKPGVTCIIHNIRRHVPEVE